MTTSFAKRLKRAHRERSCRDIAPEDMISRQDIEAFRDQGLVIKRGVLAEQARQIAGWTNEIVGWPELPGKYMMYFENGLVRPGERLLSRIENFQPYHHGFRELLTGLASAWRRTIVR